MNTFFSFITTLVFGWGLGALLKNTFFTYYDDKGND
jgi:hypothetical protein